MLGIGEKIGLITLNTENAMRKITRQAFRDWLTQRTELRYNVTEAAVEQCVKLGLDPDTAPIPEVAEEVVLVATTFPKMNKRGNPFFGRVSKVSKVSGSINWLYSKWVNDQRERENGFTVLEGGAVKEGVVEKFVAEKRRWGQRLERSPYVEHNGKYYLELGVDESLEHNYYLDGEIVPKDSELFESIKPWLPKPRKSNRQGVDNDVILRDYAEASVTAIEIDPEGAKLRFVMIDDAEQLDVAA
jgi:hypothetical protein